MEPSQTLDPSGLVALLAERHPDAELAVTPQPEKGHQDPTIEVCVAALPRVMETLRRDPRLDFDLLLSVAGVDRPPDTIEVVYHLFSFRHRRSLAVRTRTERSDPSVGTVEPIWPAAGWLEREVYDLTGVDFPGHPDLRRIMLPDDWVGHPLRKDYVKPNSYHGIDNARLKNE